MLGQHEWLSSATVGLTASPTSWVWSREVMSAIISPTWCRDSMGMSELRLIQLISPYKVSYIRGSLEIPLLSLALAPINQEESRSPIKHSLQ